MYYVGFALFVIFLPVASSVSYDTGSGWGMVGTGSVYYYNSVGTTPTSVNNNCAGYATDHSMARYAFPDLPAGTVKITITCVRRAIARPHTPAVHLNHT